MDPASLSAEAAGIVAEFRKARDPQAIRPSGQVAVAWGNKLADEIERLAGVSPGSEEEI